MSRLTPPVTLEEKLSHLRELREEARTTDPDKLAARHADGRYSARERIDKLLDPGSFQELDMFVRHRSHDFGLQQKRPLADAVITGHGTIDGRPVCVYSQDFTVYGGSLGEVMAEKIIKVMELAAKIGAPMICINDSGGARIQEGVDSLYGYGEVVMRNFRLSGVVPQISLMMGPCAGGAAYSAAMTDYVGMVKGTSYMVVTGPEVVRLVTGEAITAEELGGAEVHSKQSGVAHFAWTDEDHAFEETRTLLSFLPSNSCQVAPRVPTDDPVDRLVPELGDIVPGDLWKAYDMREVARAIVDDGEFFEIHEQYAPNVIVGFAHLDGHAVGIVGNQPQSMAGVLDIAASEKAARFLRTCNAYNLPLITLCDVPGFMPGSKQESDGIITRGAKLIWAYGELTTPMITVITRKAYGGAYSVMGSKQTGSDMNFAWPSAEIAVMGSEAAVSVIHGRELRAAENPEARREELLDDYKTRFGNPYAAAARGFIDEVIEPEETRRKVCAALDLLLLRREPYPKTVLGNMPM